MKNNILIIAIVTFAALGVIAAVIVSSVINSESLPSDPDSSDYSQTLSLPESSDNELPPADDSSDVSDASVPESEDSSPGDSETPSGASSAAQGIAATASSLIGVPFLENGETPDGFDNSGFIYYVLRENGYMTCPRGTEAQSEMGAQLDYDSIKEGDLVFFSDEGGDKASFGGIYVGGGKMVACLMPGTSVKEVDITSSYYRSNFCVGISMS